MYKSIVFDLGGVMIDFDPRGYLVDRLCNAETEEEVYDLTFGSEEWKLEYNARTSAERCNKREKIDYKLEDGRYRSSMMWYCRLFTIMMYQHLDAWTLPKASRLKELFEQAA